MKNALIIKILLFLFLSTICEAQFGKKNKFIKKDPTEEEQTSTKTLAYGATTHNYSGLLGGLILRSSTPFSFKNNLPVHEYVALEIVGLKNPRETNYLSGAGTKYVFGKTNYFFSIRPQYGREFFLFHKDSPNSLAFSAIFAAGPSLGILKPYYIKYLFPNSRTPETVQYDPDVTKDYNNIVGSSSFLTNFGRNLKFIPGAHFKAALNMDKSAFGNNVTGFELGTVIEIFSKKPEILSSKFSKNQQTYATLYLTIYLGNKKLLKKKK